MTKVKKALFCVLLMICGALTSCTAFCRHKICSRVVLREATYTEAGEQILRCDRCGEIIEREVIDMLVCDHGKVAWVVDEEPSAEEEGRQHSVCEICGRQLEEQVIPAPGYTQEEIEEKLSASVVKVLCYYYDGSSVKSQGSGFFIDDRGTFVTNAHVINGCYYIKIETRSGEQYDVNTVCVYDAEADAAVCRADMESSEPVIFGEEAKIGDTVYSFGFPNGAETVQVTSGTISTLFKEGEKIFYSSDSAIDHGSSGGALVNRFGRVIGMTTASVDDGSFASLRYEDLREKISGPYDGERPVEGYFHGVEYVPVTAENVDEFFGFGIVSSSSDEQMIYYELISGLKTGERKIGTDGALIRVTVRIDTTYSYQEILDRYGNTEPRTQVISEYREFAFGDLTSLLEGQTLSCSEPIPDIGGPYRDMSVNIAIAPEKTASGMLKLYED